MKRFGEAKYCSYIYTKYKIKVMKEIKKSIILFILMVIAILLAPSCIKEDNSYPPLCDGNCDANYIIVYENQEITPNANGHYEIQWNGLGYFQVKGLLSELTEDYCTNDVPMVGAKFDSDYWVVFDSITFQTPMYSYLGWFNSNTLNTPIPFGNYTYTLQDLIGLHPPFNIAGYQIPANLCVECPYAPTLVGTYSMYNYTPTQNFFLDDEMIGDTINIFIETTFSINGGVWYVGRDEPYPKETITDQIKVIII
jgi:hypothetical protein